MSKPTRPILSCFSHPSKGGAWEKVRPRPVTSVQYRLFHPAPGADTGGASRFLKKQTGKWKKDYTLFILVGTLVIM